MYYCFIINTLLLLHYYYYYYFIINTLFTFTQVFTYFRIASAMGTTMITIFLQLQLPLLQFFSLQPQQSFFLETSVTETISFLFVLFFAFFLSLLNDIAACLRVIFSSLVGSTSLPEKSIRSSSLYFFTRISISIIFNATYT